MSYLRLTLRIMYKWSGKKMTTEQWRKVRKLFEEAFIARLAISAKTSPGI
jgi:hypothetical protein